jgi:hypothetical protein
MIILTTLASRASWAPSNGKCALDSRSFSLFSREHHCRVCACAAHDACAPFTEAFLKPAGAVVTVRICLRCQSAQGASNSDALPRSPSLSTDDPRPPQYASSAALSRLDMHSLSTSSVAGLDNSDKILVGDALQASMSSSSLAMLAPSDSQLQLLAATGRGSSLRLNGAAALSAAIDNSLPSAPLPLAESPASLASQSAVSLASVHNAEAVRASRTTTTCQDIGSVKLSAATPDNAQSARMQRTIYGGLRITIPPPILTQRNMEGVMTPTREGFTAPDVPRQTDAASAGMSPLYRLDRMISNGSSAAWASGASSYVPGSSHQSQQAYSSRNNWPHASALSDVSTIGTRETTSGGGNSPHGASPRAVGSPRYIGTGSYGQIQSSWMSRRDTDPKSNTSAPRRVDTAGFGIVGGLTSHSTKDVVGFGTVGGVPRSQPLEWDASDSKKLTANKREYYKEVSVGGMVGGMRYCRNCSQPFSEPARMKEFLSSQGGLWDPLSDEAATCSRDCTTSLRAEEGSLF